MGGYQQERCTMPPQPGGILLQANVARVGCIKVVAPGWCSGTGQTTSAGEQHTPVT